MRRWILLLACAAVMPAQTTETSERLAEQARVKVQEFKQKLETAMRLPADKTQHVLPAAPPPVCSIPLLEVKAAASFKSNMPVIAPDPKSTFAARELIPPAPVCDEQTKK